jgi:nitronate monooxygenase
VPEVADVLVRESPDTMLLAAGGVADGRGLAAALALGADGVLVGIRLYAAEESHVRPLHRAALVYADGDSTVRTHVADIVVSLPWPKELTARVQRNRFVERWHGQESELAQQAAVEAPHYLQAFADGDSDDTTVWFGEAAGLIGSVGSVASIIDQMVETASRLVSG